MTYEMTREEALWVAALESDEFPQGTGALNSKGKFCCLGVGCEVALRDGVVINKTESLLMDRTFLYCGSSGMAPVQFVRWVTGNPKAGQSLRIGNRSPIQMNDTLSMSFKEIAAAIRENGVQC